MSLVGIFPLQGFSTVGLIEIKIMEDIKREKPHNPLVVFMQVFYYIQIRLKFSIVGFC